MENQNSPLEGCRLVVPDGSLQEVVTKLLGDAGMPITLAGSRSYRTQIGNPRLFPPPFDVVYRLRPQQAPWIIAHHKAELAFTGTDLIAESGFGDRVVVLDTYPLARGGSAEVRIVLAVPKDSPIQSVDDLKPSHEVVTEYPSSARRWFMEHGVLPGIWPCDGSTEGYADMADAIVELTETGRSLRENGWREIGELMRAQTCLITYPEALDDPVTAPIIQEVRLLINAALAARSRSLVKCDVMADRLVAVLGLLSQFGSPTQSMLAHNQGYALEVVVDSGACEQLFPALHSAGATRILKTGIEMFVP